MVEYLKKWLYINNIENENIIQIGKIIENENKKPVIFTSQAEVLYYFWLLVNNRSNLENFFLFNEPGNTTYQYKYLVKNPIDGIYYVKFLPTHEKKDKIFIFDSKYKQLIKDTKLENSYII